MHIVYIHGANASPASFNFIRQYFGEHEATFIRYDTETDLADVVLNITEMLPKSEHVSIVGHSLGGVIGVAVSQLLSHSGIVDRIVTAGSPFSGSDVARRLRILYPFSSFIKNVSSSHPVFKRVVNIGAVVPTMSIVSTAGHNPLVDDLNDGVVTIASQLALPRAINVRVELNHYETMLSPVVGELAAEFLIDGRVPFISDRV